MRKILFLSFLLSLSGSISAKDFIVEQGGSIADAIQQARNYRRLNAAGDGVNIILRGSEYVIDEPIVLRPEDSGTATAPLTIKSAEGNMATISSRKVITGWKQQGRLWVADAPKSGNRPMLIRQLWVDGKKAPLATQFGTLEGIESPTAKMQRMTDFNKEQRTITIPTPDNIADLQQEPLLEMLVHQRWAIAILRVKALLVEGKQTKVTFHEPESSLEFSHPWPQPVIGEEKGNSSYCLQNALCLVDEPGEWYQDINGRIYYYPRKGEEMEKITISSADIERLFSIEGSPLAKVSNINIEGVAFSYAAWSRPSHKGLVTLQGGFAVTEAYKLQDAGLPWDRDLENQAWTERPQAAVRAEWGENICFTQCHFEHLSATALDLKTGMKHCIVANNTFHDIGGTAILCGSFAEGATEAHNPLIISNEEYTENISITGNTVTEATCEDWGAVGIGCGYVRNTSITDNTVCGMNYSGICVGWGWTDHDTGMRNNHIDHNTVSNYARMLYDAGGIYTLSNQPASTIIDNTIANPCNAPYATNNRAFHIYLDAKTDGYTILRKTRDENQKPTTKNQQPKTNEETIGFNHPGPSIIIDNKPIQE